MYQLYTQARPGRPQWALIASALLLLVALAFAWAVVHYKTQAFLVPLGPAKEYPAGELRCRFPAGWREQTDNLPMGGIAAAVEPGTRGQPGRQLLIFRGPPAPWEGASESAIEAIAVIVNQLSPRPELDSLGPGTVGGLPGWTMFGACTSPFSGTPGYFFARAALGPRGEIVGAMLLVAQRRAGADRQLLNQICENVQLLTVSPVKDSAAMSAAGIRFRAPRDATFFAEPNTKLARLLMTGGEGSAAWYLTAYRVPLLEGRSPATLVADLALTLLEQGELAQQPQTRQVGGHEAAELQVALSKKTSPSLRIGCAKFDAHTGLMLIGRFDPEAAATLRDVFTTVWQTATVSSYDQIADISRAREAGRQLLRDMTARGVLPGNEASERSDRYAIRSPGMTWGRETRDYKHLDASSWEIDITSRLSLGIRVLETSTEQWQFRSDVAGYTLSQNTRRTANRWTYEERKAPQGHEVQRQLKVSDARARQTVTPIDDTYTPALGLLWVAERLAREPNAGPAMLTSIEPFPRETIHCILMPIGETPLPGSSGQTAPAVMLQRDYDPSPIALFYDAAGALVAISEDGGSWRALMRPRSESE